MKLSEWARLNGVSKHTAYRWFHAGELPVPARQLPSGTILVDTGYPGETSNASEVVLYARVSSSDQRDDLDRQLGRLSVQAAKKQLKVTDAVTEIGSGLNGARPRLKRLLADPTVKTIMVEHRDRLVRFGFDYLVSALEADGRRVIVVDDGEVEDDLVRDMTEVLTGFCARLYGRRSAAARAKAALDKCSEET